MRLKFMLVLCLCLFISISLSTAEANPFPIGEPYMIMTVEDIDISVIGEHAHVTGTYSFNLGYWNDSNWNYTANPPPWEYTMLFPVADDSYDISVEFTNSSVNHPVEWKFTDMVYNTTINESLPNGSYPAELDTLPMIGWSLTLYPDGFNVTVKYSHKLPIMEVSDDRIFLYALGTGRYAHGWVPPIINGTISGKPWVDVYITLKCQNYSILNYTPGKSSEYSPEVDIFKSGDYTVLNWIAHNIEPMDDFIVLIRPVYPVTVIKINDASAPPGSTATTSINTYKSLDLANFDINVTYDPHTVIVMDAKVNPVFGTPIMNLINASDGWIRIATLNTGSGQSGNVWLVNLVLKATGDTGDKTSMNLTVNTLLNSDDEDIRHKVQNGTFRVDLPRTGDLNGDGKVDLKDAIYLAKCILRILPCIGCECQFHADPDVNCDGQVDLKDAIYLAKHVVGLPGYRLYPCEVTCTSNEDCLSGEYCAKEMGQCKGIGKCLIRPKICPLIWCDKLDYFCYSPVCGCDGNTYSNECEAAANGVSVDYKGMCKPLCKTNGDCLLSEYCAKEPRNCEGTGECKARPQVCPMYYAPVCGCDGKIYGNECEAAASGVNINPDGCSE